MGERGREGEGGREEEGEGERELLNKFNNDFSHH